MKNPSTAMAAALWYALSAAVACAQTISSAPVQPGTGLALSAGVMNLQPAGPTTIGGVNSLACAAHTWLNNISTSGVPTCAPPAIGDISGWGSNVAPALGNTLNALNGLVGFSGNIGAATGTSLALGGASIGSNALAVTGTSLFSNSISYGGVTLANSVTGTGSMVLSVSPVFSTPSLGNATAVSINGQTISNGSGTLTLGSATLNAGAGGTLGSNAFTSTAYAPIANPTFTGSFTATGLVTYADMATAAVATGAQYQSGAASVLVPASQIYQAETTTTYATTTVFDFSTFINTAVTLTGNITTQTLNNVAAGKSGHIRFIQDGTGSRTTVWNSIFKFAGGVTPTLSTAASAIDVLFYDCASATLCYASLVQNMK